MIVDDHPIVRRGLADVLATALNLDISAETDNVADAMAEIQAFQPDMIVVDMSLKESNGLDLIAAVRKRWPGIKLLAWSMFDDDVFAEHAVRAGAMGYVNKNEPVEAMVLAVEQVLQGNTYRRQPPRDSSPPRPNGTPHSRP